jgi:hypothetical protein
VTDWFDNRSVTAAQGWVTATPPRYVWTTSTSTSTSYTFNNVIELSSNWTTFRTDSATLAHYWGEQVDLQARAVADRVDREMITGVIENDPWALPPEDPALRDARLNGERAARDRSRVEASNRADDLLLSMLSPEQRESYFLNNHFEVIGSCGNRYRIREGVSGNIDWLDDETGEVKGRLCAHPTMERDWLPVQDVAVAQLLALTTDEMSFVRVANVHWGQRPPTRRRRRDLVFAVGVGSVA